jgi:formamidopyrimidine-DNA glycosylase
MPELPEAETIARTLSPMVAGRRITQVEVLLPRVVHPLSLPLAALCGRRIAKTGRRGKLVLLMLEAEKDMEHTAAPCTEQPDMLAVHLRMTGRLFVYPAGQSAGKHTRAIFTLDDGHKLFFDDARTFGLLFLGTEALRQRWPFWRTLGAEPLLLQGSALYTAVHARRAAIKAVLLDQKVLAGVGNIYADESLFRASIDPRRPAASLSQQECRTLLACLHEVLQESIAQCGSSIRDYRDAHGDAGAFQNSFHVYGRGGQPCHSCGCVLERCTVAGRGTVFCPHCQH